MAVYKWVQGNKPECYPTPCSQKTAPIFCDKSFHTDSSVVGLELIRQQTNSLFLHPRLDFTVDDALSISHQKRSNHSGQTRSSKLWSMIVVRDKI